MSDQLIARPPVTPSRSAGAVPMASATPGRDRCAGSARPHRVVPRHERGRFPGSTEPHNLVAIGCASRAYSCLGIGSETESEATTHYWPAPPRGYSTSRDTAHVHTTAAHEVGDRAVAVEHAPAVITLEEWAGYRESARDPIHDWSFATLREMIACPILKDERVSERRGARRFSSRTPRAGVLTGRHIQSRQQDGAPRPLSLP